MHCVGLLHTSHLIIQCLPSSWTTSGVQLLMWKGACLAGPLLASSRAQGALQACRSDTRLGAPQQAGTLFQSVGLQIEIAG